jgi:hypothetical protein
MVKHLLFVFATISLTGALIGCGGGSDNNGIPDTGTVGTRILGTWKASSIQVGEDVAACPGGEIGAIKCPTSNAVFRHDGTATFDGKSISYFYFDHELRLTVLPPQIFDVEFSDRGETMTLTGKALSDFKITLRKVSL